jgi:hypothetical protein
MKQVSSTHYTLVLSSEMNYQVELYLTFEMAVSESETAAQSLLAVSVFSRLIVSPVLNVVNAVSSGNREQQAVCLFASSAYSSTTSLN